MLYSGNLNAYRDAKDRWNNEGYTVRTITLSSNYAHVKVVTDSTGLTVLEKRFFNRDEDLLFMEMTDWLNREFDAKGRCWEQLELPF